MCVLAVMSAVVLCVLLGDGGDVGGMLLSFAVVATPAAAVAVGEPLTTSAVGSGSPNLNLDDIDQVITKIRPMRTPLDQLSRYAGYEKVGSNKVRAYSVDTRPTKTAVAVAYEEPTALAVTAAAVQGTIQMTDNACFDVGDTILIPAVRGYKVDGTTQAGSLMLLVVAKSAEGYPIVRAANGKKIGTVEKCVPTIAADSVCVRMGKAAAELDVLVAQFEMMPKDDENYCQRFKCMVEESTWQSMINKEVNWTLSDQEEAGIYDMKLGMEKSFFIGVKSEIYDPNKKSTIYTTGGIWEKAGKQYEYVGTADWTYSNFVDMAKLAFVGNNGGSKKVLFAGSELLAKLNKIKVDNVALMGKTVKKWGIDFNEVVTHFGTFYILHYELLNDLGMSANGFALDPDFLKKKCFEKMKSEVIDLQKLMIRDSKGVLMTETSCVFITNPDAHMRIVAVAAPVVP